MEDKKVARKYKILIIEDDPLLVKMYKTKFTNEGMEVASAVDGEEGLRLATTLKLDVVILDIMMPKMSGIDFLVRLNEKTMVKRIPVVVLSNLSNEKDMKRAHELGVKEYLVKANYTPKDVVEIVKKYLV